MRRYYKPWEQEGWGNPQRDAEASFSKFYADLTSQLEESFAQWEASQSVPATTVQTFSPTESGAGLSETPRSDVPGPEFGFGLRDVASKVGKTGIKEGIKSLLGGTFNPVADLMSIGSAPISHAKGYFFGKPSSFKSSLLTALTEAPLSVVGSMTAGPVGSIVGSIFGRALGTGLSDLAGVRSKEAIRDAVEDMFGPFDFFRGWSAGTQAAEAWDTLGEMESAWANPDFVKDTTSAFMESIQEDPYEKYNPSIFGKSIFDEEAPFTHMKKDDPLTRALREAIGKDVRETQARKDEEARIAADEARERALQRGGSNWDDVQDWDSEDIDWGDIEGGGDDSDVGGFTDPGGGFSGWS